MEDYKNFIRLTQHFNAVHMIGNQVTSPIEMPANSRHLDCYLANLTLSDRSYHCTSIGRGRAMDGIRMMAIARGISLDDMLRDPGVTTIISVNSPRRFDDAARRPRALVERGHSVARLERIAGRDQEPDLVEGEALERDQRDLEMPLMRRIE